MSRENSETKDLTNLLQRFPKDEIIKKILENEEKKSTKITKKDIIKQAIGFLTERFSDLDELILFLQLKYLETEKVRKRYWSVYEIEKSKTFSKPILSHEKISKTLMKYFNKYGNPCNAYSEKKGICIWMALSIKNTKSRGTNMVYLVAHTKLSVIFLSYMNSYPSETAKVLRKSFRGSDITQHKSMNENAFNFLNLNFKSFQILKNNNGKGRTNRASATSKKSEIVVNPVEDKISTERKVFTVNRILEETEASSVKNNALEKIQASPVKNNVLKNTEASPTRNIILKAAEAKVLRNRILRKESERKALTVNRILEETKSSSMKNNVFKNTEASPTRNNILKTAEVKVLRRRIIEKAVKNRVAEKADTKTVKNRIPEKTEVENRISKRAEVKTVKNTVSEKTKSLPVKNRIAVLRRSRAYGKRTKLFPDSESACIHKVTEENIENDQRRRKYPRKSLENQNVPAIDSLQYIMTSAPIYEEKKDSCDHSIFTVRFDGKNVLNGLKEMVSSGLADGPLPDYLYKEPRTGKTKFQLHFRDV